MTFTSICDDANTLCHSLVSVCLSVYHPSVSHSRFLFKLRDLVVICQANLYGPVTQMGALATQRRRDLGVYPSAKTGSCFDLQKMICATRWQHRSVIPSFTKLLWLLLYFLYATVVVLILFAGISRGV